MGSQTSKESEFEIVFKCGKCKRLNKTHPHVVMVANTTSLFTPDGPYAAIQGKWIGLCENCYKIACSDGHTPNVMGFKHERKEENGEPVGLPREADSTEEDSDDNGGTEKGGEVATGEG